MDYTYDVRPAIEVRELSKRYKRGKTTFAAVRPMTLTVPPRQVFGLLGPNGAGKTTTIKMIAGLITPTSGTVQLGGHDVAHHHADAVRQIGAVLEGSRNVYWPLSAWENLMYFGRLKGVRGPVIKPRARRLLTELGLWERRHEPVGSFSRGMQQKVAVAAALITDPPILLLDEPTLGLDVAAARVVKDWIGELARDEGKTIVLTTHQLEVAQELSNRIAVIKDGAIIADLPTTELLSQHAENRFEVRFTGSSTAVPLPAGAESESDSGETLVRLPDADTAALYAFLDRVRAARVELVSVARTRPSLEEVFLRLVDDTTESGAGRVKESA